MCVFLMMPSFVLGHSLHIMHTSLIVQRLPTTARIGLRTLTRLVEPLPNSQEVFSHKENGSEGPTFVRSLYLWRGSPHSSHHCVARLMSVYGLDMYLTHMAHPYMLDHFHMCPGVWLWTYIYHIGP
ncbi:hypothetical protein H5410_018399 [Solanum commersonii]|uniref:Uncharacterized protein n=1 Tax=Solanum commersonii TaxID=4109 RepID=A0A9J6A3A0_SOLCO|nr:hypothetical protein H5410_018399 [Solanum commersonii]